MKKCYECGKSKLLAQFHKSRLSKHDYICIECCAKRVRKWYQDNKEEIDRKNKANYYVHRDGILAYHKKYWKEEKGRKIKEYREENRVMILEYAKGYNESYRNRRNELRKERRRVDPKFKLSANISTAIWASLHGRKNGRKWEKLVGYSVEELKRYLEITMPKNHAWEDFLGGRLEIDHIIPIDAFNFYEPEHLDFQRCWALENLRLLPANENRKKHSKLKESFQPLLALEV